MSRRPPCSTLFPTRRSSDLRLSQRAAAGGGNGDDAVTTTEAVVHRGRRRVGHPALAIDHKGVLVLTWCQGDGCRPDPRSEEHTSELQSHSDLVCRLLLEKKK